MLAEPFARLFASHRPWLASTRSFTRKKLVGLHFSGIGCITPVGIALSRSSLYHVTCPVSCPVASSLALALPAVALALPALVKSPHAAYHPRASSCFFSFRLQHFRCSASQLQRRQHTHSDSRAATFRDRKRTDVPSQSLTSHRSTKQNNKRHVAIEAQTLEAQ